MSQVTYMCVHEICKCPPGERCGNPVPKPLKIRYLIGEGKYSAEIEIGLCEECWNRVLRADRDR
jgi:hypothetical protein